MNSSNNFQGKAIIISAPSGAGKTTLVNKLLDTKLPLLFSISACSRAPREGEEDKKDYYFLSIEKFKEKIKAQDFIEWEEVYEGNFYGTLKTNVDAIIKDNDILFDIDWQGTKQLSKFKNLNLVKIYITTEDKSELKKRLIKRNQNSIKEVEKRFNSFDQDIQHWNDYDYVIINKNLEVCFKQIEKIIKNAN